jgi:uncharacterized protein YbbC (DUF1343 family)
VRLGLPLFALSLLSCHPAARSPRAAPLAAVALPAAGAAVDAATDVTPFVPDPRWSAVDDAVNAAIGEAKLPGCVVVIGRRDTILYAKAYGSRALVPARESMTLDTVFDMASLTKSIATATSLAVLADLGALAYDDPVAKYLPEFAHNGKGAVTLRQVLTHTSGLPVETPYDDYAAGPDEALRRLANLALRSSPGEQYRYSDVGFVVLGEVVRRVSGQDLGAFATDHIFAKLGMHDTAFLPSDPLKLRAVTTEQRDGVWLRGEVHDPRAHLLGGVAGHAGLFSTAQDLSVFAQMLLGEGEHHGVRVLSSSAVRAMTAPHDVPGGVRALGWDIKTVNSTNRGDALSPRAFGHGGYTGTSLWMDPEKDLFVLVLSNRVHPDGKGAVNPLAGAIANIAADGVGPSETPLEVPCDRPASDVMTGIDVLRAEEFARLRGAHVGLITNATGRARDGKTTIELLKGAPLVTLVALFAPEHGLTIDRDALIPSSTDSATGLPVYSLYGDAFAPTPEMLAGIDTIVFDIQDVGVRFFTYASTMRRAMQVAAARGLRFLVLDRPNPIDGVDVAGPVLAASPSNFVNHHALPVRHGMTIGELAVLFNADLHLGTRLEVVRLSGWRRSDDFDGTGLLWVSPSPNLRSTTEAFLYPGVGLLEGTNLSVGRGTDAPFELIGSPWIDGAALAAALTKVGLGGVAFSAASFTPTASVYHGEVCHGVRITVTSRSALDPLYLGIALAKELRRMYRAEWHFNDVDRLLQSKRALAAIDAQEPLAQVEATWASDLSLFRAKREKYLLYPPNRCPAKVP